MVSVVLRVLRRDFHVHRHDAWADIMGIIGRWTTRHAQGTRQPAATAIRPGSFGSFGSSGAGEGEGQHLSREGKRAQKRRRRER